MPRAVKRKTDSTAGSPNAKKSKNDKNMELFEKMKREADENKRIAEQKRQAEAQSRKPNRRTTIAATSTSRPPQNVNATQKPSRRSINVPKPSPHSSRGSRRSTPESEPPSQSEEDSSSEEDEFDRLVQRRSSKSGRSSGRKGISASQDEYAKVYTRPSSRTPSKRQTDFLKRQEDLFNQASRGYHSSDDSESEAESDAEGEPVVPKKSAKSTKPAVVSQKEASSAATGAWPKGKDDMMLQIDSILYSAVSMILGVLLVVVLFVAMNFLDSSGAVTALPGVGAYFHGAAKRVSMLVVALAITFVGYEVFKWLSQRANSRKLVVSELAKEAKAIIKAKAQTGDMRYPSKFVMEDVLEKCSEISLYEQKLNRSTIKSIWPEVETALLEDARLQRVDVMVEGKKQNCLR